MSEKKSDQQRISAVPPFGLRMLPRLRERLEKAAGANGRSMNAEIVARLERSLDENALNEFDTLLTDKTVKYTVSKAIFETLKSISSSLEAHADSHKDIKISNVIKNMKDDFEKSFTQETEEDARQLGLGVSRKTVAQARKHP